MALHASAAIMADIMKIHQLPMGARFEFEGEEYVKTGPLAPAREDFLGSLT